MSTLRSVFRKAGCTLAAASGALGGLLLIEHCRRSAPHRHYTGNDDDDDLLSAKLYNVLLPAQMKVQLQQWRQWLDKQRLMAQKWREDRSKIPLSRRIADQLTWSNLKAVLLASWWAANWAVDSAYEGTLAIERLHDILVDGQNWRDLEQILMEDAQSAATFTKQFAIEFHAEWTELLAHAAQDWRYVSYVFCRFLNEQLIPELEEAEKQLLRTLEEVEKEAKQELEVLITDAEEYARLVGGRAASRREELTASLVEFEALFTDQVIPFAEMEAKQLAQELNTLLGRLQQTVPTVPNELQCRAEQALEEVRRWPAFQQLVSRLQAEADQAVDDLAGLAKKAVQLYDRHCQPLTLAYQSLIADGRAIAADFAAARTVSVEDVRTYVAAVAALADEHLALAGQIAIALLHELDSCIDKGLTLLGALITLLDITVLLGSALRQLPEINLKESRRKLIQRVEELQQEALLTYEFLGRPQLLDPQLLDQLFELRPEQAVELVALEADYTADKMATLFEHTLPCLYQAGTQAVGATPEVLQELAEATSLASAALVEDAAQIATGLHQHSTGVQRAVRLTERTLQVGSWAVKEYLSAVVSQVFAPAVGALVMVLSAPATLVTAAVDHLMVTTPTTTLLVDDQTKKTEEGEEKEEEKTEDTFSWITSFNEKEAELVREKYIFIAKDDVLSDSRQMLDWQSEETVKEEEEEKAPETPAEQIESEEIATAEMGDSVLFEAKEDNDELLQSSQPELDLLAVAEEDESCPETEEEEKEEEEEDDYSTIINWPYAVETPEDWHTSICIADYSSSSKDKDNGD